MYVILIALDPGHLRLDSELTLRPSELLLQCRCHRGLPRKSKHEDVREKSRTNSWPSSIGGVMLAEASSTAAALQPTARTKKG